MNTDGELDRLRRRLRRFAAERDWDQFHSPKNLAMALIVEAAELVEHFQWLTEEQSGRLDPEIASEVEEELADIFIYVIRLADQLEVDLVTAADAKIEKNEAKYPADLVRGQSKKYDRY